MIKNMSLESVLRLCKMFLQPIDILLVADRGVINNRLTGE